MIARGLLKGKRMGWVVFSGYLLFSARAVFSLETLTLALPAKSFQQVIYPFAQEKGYMKEEGIDLKIVFMEATPSIQALVAGSVQFTGAGSSALVALARWVSGNREHLVILRPFENGLVLHTMYYADEVRDFGAVEIEAAPNAPGQRARSVANHCLENGVFVRALGDTCASAA